MAGKAIQSRQWLGPHVAAQRDVMPPTRLGQVDSVRIHSERISFILTIRELTRLPFTVPDQSRSLARVSARCDRGLRRGTGFLLPARSLHGFCRDGLPGYTPTGSEASLWVCQPALKDCWSIYCFV
ncbi:hypothetical protein Bbelb_005660 [Branchiostoma belcheri]|nr:hypothetical protein Bbelb_005660 [Branchiostoma belcheri]